MEKMLLVLALCSTYLCAGYIQDHGTSPDGSLTVVIDDSWFGQTTVNVYDQKNVLVAHFPGNAASFSPTGRLLATWNTRERVTHIYETRTWQPTLTCDHAVGNISDVFRGQDPFFIAGDEILDDINTAGCGLSHRMRRTLSQGIDC